MPSEDIDSIPFPPTPLIRARTTSTSTIYALDRLVFLELCLGNPANTRCVEVGFFRLDAAQATKLDRFRSSLAWLDLEWKGVFERGTPASEERERREGGLNEKEEEEMQLAGLPFHNLVSSTLLSSSHPRSCFSTASHRAAWILLPSHSRGHRYIWSL